MQSGSVVANRGIVRILSERLGFYRSKLRVEIDSCFRIRFWGRRAFYSGGSDVGGCYA